MKYIIINQNKRINKLAEYFKNGIVLFIMSLIMLVSVNANAQKTKLTDKEVAYMKAEFRKGMASFVESVKPIYTSGMSYNSFKSSLIGTSVKNITGEGEALLNKAYTYLVNSRSSNFIIKNDSGKEIAVALFYTKKYNLEKKSTNGDLVLFGNLTGNSFPGDSLLNKQRECRWYQVGCHLANAWDWLVNGGMDEITSIIEDSVGILLLLQSIGIDFLP